MRIVNKKRFITSISIMIMLVISLFNLCFANVEKLVNIEEYTVTAGDTLWSIASEYATGDIREYIYELRQLNNLDDCLIYPNQTIKIIK